MKACLCHWAGCNAVCSEYYCAKHKAKRDEERKQWNDRQTLFKDTKRDKSSPYHHLYESSKWRTIRRKFLSQNPNCIRCGAKATIADHITPHRGDEGLFYNQNNLQPMCWSCHSAKTLAENNYFHSKRLTGRG